MKFGKGHGIAALVVFVATAVVPPSARLLRSGPANRCSLDGEPIVDLYRVRAESVEGRTRMFCCVRCAEIWLERNEAGIKSIQATDESSGEEIDAGAAYYVRSPIVTQPRTSNRVHVFSRREDAEKHLRAHGGKILQGPDRPLQITGFR